MKLSPLHRGFTLLELLVVIGILIVLFALLIPAVQRVRDAAARTRCQSNLRQIGIGLHSYHDTFGLLPPGVRAYGSDYPFMGWMARILPFVDQAAVWKQALQAYGTGAYFNEDPPHPFANPLPLYGCPADPRSYQVNVGRDSVGLLGSVSRVAFTSYLGVEGLNQTRKDGCLFLNSLTRLADISDGTSNTLLVGERPASADGFFGWWYGGWGQSQDGSGDVVLGVRERNVYLVSICPPGLSNFGPGHLTNQCDELHFWSPHVSGGSHFLFADDSVHFLTYSIAPLMPALASRNGGEEASIPY